MPLQNATNSRRNYIRRVRVFVDPEQRDLQRSEDQYSFVFPLNNLYEKVGAIELVDFQVRRNVQTMFYDAQKDLPANRYVDIYLEDTATGLQTLSFTVILPPNMPNPSKRLVDFAAAMQTEFQTQMDALGDAYFNSSNSVEWEIGNPYDISGRFTNFYGLDGELALEYWITDGGTADSIKASFLFGSGANADRSAARALGFAEGVDTAPFTSGGVNYYTPQQPYEMLPYPFRYLDVRIDQFPELDPVARIYLSADESLYKRTNEIPNRFRLLTDPVRQLDELRVRLTLPGGRKPNLYLQHGVDLVFDLYLISPEARVPKWVRQTLEC